MTGKITIVDLTKSLLVVEKKDDIRQEEVQGDRRYNAHTAQLKLSKLRVGQFLLYCGKDW